MGNCSYCGESAGWLKNVHNTCRRANDEAKVALVEAIASWLPQHPDTTDFAPLLKRLREIATQGHVSELDVLAASREGIYAALENYLDDNLLSKLEEHHLVTASEALGIDTAYLWAHKNTRRFIGAATIRRVIEGEPWEKPWNPSDYGLVLGSGEELLWVEQGLTLHEPKTVREYTGASSGVSVRLARGVYYRVGQFRGRPIDRTEVVEVARGNLCLTNQQICFIGGHRGFGVPYKKLAAVHPFEDGVGLQRNGVNAKPQYLHGADGWLLHNLIMNFAELSR